MMRLTGESVNLDANSSTLPHAWRILSIAVRHGFQLNSARPAAVLERTGHVVAWSNSFVDEMRQAVKAARIGYEKLCITVASRRRALTRETASHLWSTGWLRTS